jgi:hypothetical protein
MDVDGGGGQRRGEAEEQRRGGGADQRRGGERGRGSEGKRGEGEDDQKTTEEGGFLLKAMRGFEKLREKVKGKSLFRNRETGEIRVVKDRREVREERIELDNLTVIGEEVAIEVELREEKGSGSSTRSSLLLVGGSSAEGYNFLEALDEEPEDVKEKEKRESRKRKRVEEIRIEVRQSGLKNTHG